MKTSQNINRIKVLKHSQNLAKYYKNKILKVVKTRNINSIYKIINIQLVLKYNYVTLLNINLN